MVKILSQVPECPIHSHILLARLLFQFINERLKRHRSTSKGDGGRGAHHFHYRGMLGESHFD